MMISLIFFKIADLENMSNLTLRGTSVLSSELIQKKSLSIDFKIKSKGEKFKDLRLKTVNLQSKTIFLCQIGQPGAPR